MSRFENLKICRKTILVLLIISLFIAPKMRAQEKFNDRIDIFFKPKSTRLLKREKKKIINFIKTHPIDSNFAYAIRSRFEGCTAKKFYNSTRVNKINNYLTKKNNKWIITIWDVWETRENYILELAIIEKPEPSTIPFPFPNGIFKYSKK